VKNRVYSIQKNRILSNRRGWRRTQKERVMWPTGIKSILVMIGITISVTDLLSRNKCFFGKEKRELKTTNRALLVMGMEVLLVLGLANKVFVIMFEFCEQWKEQHRNH
jgi:hypothetical protein